ncbi:MAG TPA: thiamine pyrophosphate-dependent enzyme [Gaiellaceae bacterium]|nr:thiamine pyrophosphate-dependent enzyme [Gaiellaceae bacterium]
MNVTRTYEPAAPVWCAGCGHFGVLNALRAVLRDLELPLHEVFVVAGIGCSGSIQNYLGAYGYHALHGRLLPAAAGAALANPELTVIGAGGDGDGYAIGAGHLVHAFRRNVPFTYLLMNNETYGLTKGQRSPGRFVDRDPGEGWVDGALLGLGIPSSTFVARGYSGWPEQLARLLRAAIEHARSGRGFAFLEVVSPCVTYDDTYSRWRHVLHDVDADPGWDATDRAAAFRGAVRLAAEDRLPAGLIFRAPDARPRERPAPASAPLEGEAVRRRLRELAGRYLVDGS